MLYMRFVEIRFPSRPMRVLFAGKPHKSHVGMGGFCGAGSQPVGLKLQVSRNQDTLHLQDNIQAGEGTCARGEGGGGREQAQPAKWSGDGVKPSFISYALFSGSSSMSDKDGAAMDQDANQMQYRAPMENGL